MSAKLPVITSKQLIRALKKAGFIIHGQKGSHVHMKHLGPPVRIVSVPFHNVDIKKGLLRSIIRQAGMSKEEMQKYL